MFKWLKGNSPVEDLFSNIPSPPFAPGLLPRVRRRHPVAGEVVAAFDARWLSAGGQRNYASVSTRIAGVRIQQGVSVPGNLNMMPISDGELQIGFNGLGFLGQESSSSWTWEEIATGEVFYNGLKIILYEGKAVGFSRDRTWSDSDGDKLGYLMANLQNFYDKYGANWADED